MVEHKEVMEVEEGVEILPEVVPEESEESMELEQRLEVLSSSLGLSDRISYESYNFTSQRLLSMIIVSFNFNSVVKIDHNYTPTHQHTCIILQVKTHNLQWK